MIKVLIVDDSLTAREYLKQVLNTDPELTVIGEAKDGKEAVLFAEKNRPNVVVMDIQMPGINGYEATRAIMEKCPVPIVINSFLATPGQTEIVFQAMKAGAVAVCQKPSGYGHPDSDELVEKLLRTVKLMSEVKVVRLFKRKGKHRDTGGTEGVSTPSVEETESKIDIIGIGASTGGPPVLHSILSNLSKKFSTPIIIVQHIATGFLEGMLEWLSKETHLQLRIPKTGEPILIDHVYFCPEDHHMGITPSRHFMISKIPPDEVAKRPITYLFNSLAKIYGNSSVGILLTGMGNDGAHGLKEMKSTGSLTMVQNKETSVVFGMPGEAVKLDAAEYILSPYEIVSFLNTMVK